MESTNFRTTFALIKNMFEIMSERKLKLTPKEIDLIESIRNFKRSYPNSEPEGRWFIERLFNELMDEDL